jgi:hypothetical protein
MVQYADDGLMALYGPETFVNHDLAAPTTFIFD